MANSIIKKISHLIGATIRGSYIEGANIRWPVGTGTGAGETDYPRIELRSSGSTGTRALSLVYYDETGKTQFMEIFKPDGFVPPLIVENVNLGQHGNISSGSVQSVTYTPTAKSGYTAHVVSVFTNSSETNANYGSVTVGWKQDTVPGACTIYVANNSGSSVNPGLRAKVVYVRNM